MSPVRPLREGDLDAWLRVRRASFGTPRDPYDEGARRILISRLPFSRGYEREGRLVACCSWYPYPAWIGGVRVPTGALAAVVSAPEARRRGHVRELVVAGLRELHEREVGWALEHPFDPIFYDRLGFRTVPAGAYLELPVGRLPGRARDVDFAPSEPTDPELRRIRAVFAAAHGFALDRDDRAAEPANDADALPLRWRRLCEPGSDGVTPATAYRCEGGYALLATEGFGRDGVLHVVDAAWTDPAGRARVLAMLDAWRGQADRVRLDLPATDPIALDEAHEFGRRRTVLQARIVDVAAALAPLGSERAAARGDVVLRVRDPLCDWNDGVWRIELSEAGSRARRGADAPEATLTVGALAAVLGGVPPAAVRAVGDAEGELAPLQALATLTDEQPPFLGRADHF